MAETQSDTLATLIVDDEPLAVDRLRLICEQLPMVRVAGTASDGAQALERIAELSPDLVLLDLTMPELDGLGVARQLAAQANPPAVIFVTAHDNHAVEAFDLDAVDYVLKPVEKERLERAIARVLGAPKGAAEGAEESAAGSNAASPGSRSCGCRIVRSWSGSGCRSRRIDAERDYVRCMSEPERSAEISAAPTIAGLEASSIQRASSASIARSSCAATVIAGCATMVWACGRSRRPMARRCGSGEPISPRSRAMAGR